MTKRNVVKNLRLSEISGVTVPAQSHALVAVMKSDDTEIAKYLATDEGAKTFDAFMADEIRTKRRDEVYAEIWPLLDALRNTIVSIRLDGTLNDEQKQEKITEAVAQFGATSQHPFSSVTQDMMKYQLEESDNMSAELEAKIAELTKKLADSEVVAKMTDDEKEYLANLDKEDADAFRAASAADRAKLMKKSADSDEVFKSADGHEIRKSSVGDGVFAILKAQDEALRNTREEMVKAADRALTVEFTKKAEDELSNLPGEVVAKVAVLKGINGMSEDAQAALNAMLKAGNEALAKGFQSFGVSGGKPSDITKSAKLEAAIKKIRDADATVTYSAAMNTALAANPDLYEG